MTSNSPRSAPAACSPPSPTAPTRRCCPTVRRFRDENGQLRQWECAASLGLRNRDLDAVAEYERRGRIHAGPLARMQDTSYRAWLADHLAFHHAAADAAAAAAVSDRPVRRGWRC